MGPLCELFPRVFRVVSNKESVVTDYYEVWEEYISWSVSFRKSLHRSEEVQYEELLSIFFLTFFM